MIEPVIEACTTSISPALIRKAAMMISPTLPRSRSGRRRCAGRPRCLLQAALTMRLPEP